MVPWRMESEHLLKLPLHLHCQTLILELFEAPFFNSFHIPILGPLNFYSKFLFFTTAGDIIFQFPLVEAFFHFSGSLIAPQIPSLPASLGVRATKKVRIKMVQARKTLCNWVPGRPWGKNTARRSTEKQNFIVCLTLV